VQKDIFSEARFLFLLYI